MGRHILPISLIIILSTAIYANTLKNGFVYDDEFTIVNNTFIKDLTNLPKLLHKNDYFVHSGEGSYRPVVTFTYFLDYALFGIEPWGYHLTNVLLHTINGVLLYIFTTLLIQPQVAVTRGPTISRFFANPSFLISILFITHPVLTEAVNAVSYREDLLVFLFYMATLNLYLLIRSSASRFSSNLLYITSYITYILALIAKEMAVTLPLIIYCYEWIHKGSKSEKLLSNRFNIGYIAITLVYTYFRFYLFQNPVSVENPGWSINERFLTIPGLLLNYLKLTILPISLSADYWIPPVKSALSIQFYAPSTVMFLLSTAFLLKRSKELAFGAMFFVITLIPVYNIIPITNPFAERYLYLPSIGVATVAGLTVNIVARSVKRYFFWIPMLLSAIICINSLVVMERNLVWRDDLSLWSHTVKKRPYNGRARFNLGRILSKNGRFDEAIKEFQIALTWNPSDVDILSNLGFAYHQEGRLDEAVQSYLTAIKLDSNSANIYRTLGNVYMDQNQFAKAAEVFKVALRRNPNDQSSHFNLGLAYHKQGLFDEAKQEYLIASKLNPDDLDVHRNLGAIYHECRQFKEAIQEYMSALKLNPNDSISHFNLGLVYHNIGRLDSAVEEYLNALRLNPQFTEAHYYLGLIYQTKGLIDKAKMEFEIALQINSDFLSARKALKSIAIMHKSPNH